MVTPLLLPISLAVPVLAKSSGAASLTVWLSAYKWRLVIGPSSRLASVCGSALVASSRGSRRSC